MSRHRHLVERNASVGPSDLGAIFFYCFSISFLQDNTLSIFLPDVVTVQVEDLEGALQVEHMVGHVVEGVVPVVKLPDLLRGRPKAGQARQERHL